MIITKYADLSDSKELVQVKSGKLIKEYFPNLNWNNWAIFVNGERKTQDYITKDKDLIIIRTIPHATGALIAFGAIALISAVYSGYQSYKANKEAEKAKKELEKIKSSTVDDITNLPWLKGAQNTLSTGKTQPYIIGRHLFTPYILNAGGNGSKGYSTISGANGVKQFYNVLLEAGFNKQQIEKVYCDDIVIRNFGSTTAQEFPDINGNNNLPLNESVFASDDSFIEIAQDGNSFSSVDSDGSDLFNYKVVEKQYQDEIKKHAAEGEDDSAYEDLYYTLEPNTKAFDLCILFNGLYGRTEEGTKGNTTRNIVPYYSLDYAQIVAEDGDPDSATWLPFTFTKAQWVDSVTTKQTAKYVYRHYNTKEKLNAQTLKSYRANWEYTSGDSSILDNYDQIEYTYNVLWGSGRPYYVYYITITKTTYAPGYSTGAVQTTAFTGQFSEQIRFNAHVDFSFSQLIDSVTEGGATVYNTKYSQPITIKITCPDKELKSGTAYDDCYVQWIHSYTFDKIQTLATGGTTNQLVSEKNINEREAALSTLIGLHIESSTSNEDKLKSIQIITSGTARTWDGTQWSTEKTATSNPASWLFEVLTSDAHTPSQVDDTEIDLSAFGELYEYCEANYIEANYVITSGQTKSAVLELLCNLAHCVLYQNIYGEISVAIDRVNENAIAIFNEQNLISFSYEKELKRPVDGVKVKYINAENDFQEDTFILMYDGTLNPENRSSDCILKELNIDGCTTFSQAYRHALYVMRCDKLRPVKATAQVGKEAIYYTPLAKVKVQHPALKNGLGSAEIKSVIVEDSNIVGLQLYDAIELDTVNDFNVVIQCVSSSYSSPLARQIDTTVGGRVKEIRFTNPIPLTNAVIPHKGDILSYGYEVETITREMLISDISPNAQGFSLTLVDYNSAIYSDNETIPDYEPNFTIPRKTTTDSKTLEIQRQINELEPRSITGVTSYTALSATTVKPAVTEFSTTAKTPTQDHPYLWQYVVISYSDGTTSGTYQDACIIGAKGEKGDIGDGSEAAQQALDLATIGQTFSSVRYVEGEAISTEELIERIDQALKEAQSGIEITDEKISIKVENLEEETQSLIELTADQILQTVQNNKEALQSALVMTSTAIDAIVQGGGTSGRLSVSLELPNMITGNTRTALINASGSSESLVNSVYGSYDIVSGYAQDGTQQTTRLYAIKSNATEANIKSLWIIAKNDISIGLGSQITLDADQIVINGTSVFNSNGKLKQANTDFTGYETESAAQAIANTAEANRQALITALSQDPTSGNTIIDGGYLKTSLIDADGVLANDIKSTGSIRVGDRFNANGTVADNTKTGAWFGNSGVLKAHKAELTDVVANGGTFKNEIIMESPALIKTSNYNEINSTGFCLEAKTGGMELCEFDVMRCNEISTRLQRKMLLISAHFSYFTNAVIQNTPSFFIQLNPIGNPSYIYSSDFSGNTKLTKNNLIDFVKRELHLPTDALPSLTASFKCQGIINSDFHPAYLYVSFSIDWDNNADITFDTMKFYGFDSEGSYENYTVQNTMNGTVIF